MSDSETRSDAADVPKSAPTRTCAGCRKTDARDALLRFVLAPEGSDLPLVPDVSRKLPGRGVSVHATRACLSDAVRRGFSRSLRRPVRVDFDRLREATADQYRRRVHGLLLSASRTRALAVGTEAVRAAIHAADERMLLIVATDAAGRRRELTEMTQRLGGACVVFGTKAQIGRLLSRDEVSVLAVTNRGIAAEIARAAACVSELSEEE